MNRKWIYLIILFIFIASFALNSNSRDIYKCVDKNGNVTFSDVDCNSEADKQNNINPIYSRDYNEGSDYHPTDSHTNRHEKTEETVEMSVERSLLRVRLITELISNYPGGIKGIEDKMVDVRRTISFRKAMDLPTDDLENELSELVRMLSERKMDDFVEEIKKKLKERNEIIERNNSLR